MLEELKEKLRNLFPDDPYPAIDDRVPCPECGRQMLYRDIWEHFFIQHLNVRELYNTEEKVEGRTEKKVRLRDLLDNYEVDRTEQDLGPDTDIEIQSPKGSSKSLDKDRLRNKWRPFLQRLEEQGQVEISTSQHFNGLRGHHIAQRFKQVAYRLEIEISVEMKDRSAIIQKV